MIVSATSISYTLTLNAREREQLVVAVEYDRAMRLGDLNGARILLDLDPERLDRLADAMFLVGVPS